MKYLLLITLLSSVSFADCTETNSLTKEEVAYNVNTAMPKHLKGATITVTLANGKTSTVPAEKFMVVPRVQKTIVGENKILTKNLTCKSDKKNIAYVDVRKDHQDLKTESNGKTAKVVSEKGLVPSVNYYRREILDSDLGLGVGVDSNGTLKGAVGIDF